MSGPVVVVAGASGFVGRALLPRLAARGPVIGLGRGGPPAGLHPGVVWRRTDLFNLREAEAGLDGADVAVYLVHSMLPQAALTQARFDDLDLICADNFARAAARAGIRRIVYLGGLLPPDAGAGLSRHLASRREVEAALGAHGAAVTTLRAGLIIGAGGSSFDMMFQLVRRLPVMVAPRWSRTRSQPIALDDVLPLLERAIADPALAGRAHDIGGPDVVTYADMLRLTGRALGRRVRVLTLPVDTVNLSLLWVSAITGAPQALVRPLVESLGHDMIVTDGGSLQALAGVPGRPLADAIAAAWADHQAAAAAPAPVAPRPAPGPRRVCSVQRLPLPPGADARAVADAYLRWLPRFLGALFAVELGGGEARGAEVCRFRFRPLRRPLLELTRAPDRSSADRQLFFVTGGLLADAAAGGSPRLEFRVALGGAALIAAVLDFAPRLPWPVYRLTQGPFHLLVMRAFGRHLGARGAAG